MHYAAEKALQIPPDNCPPPPANVMLIIAILPFPATSICRAVKHFGDVEEGIPMQCIVSSSSFDIGIFSV